MYWINRSVAILKPKQPFLDWLKRTPDPPVSLTLGELRQDCTAILLPEYDHEEEAQAFIETIYLELFEVELESWYRDSSFWPADRSYQAFLAWFEIELYSMVLDPQKGRIIRQRYPGG